MDLHLVVFEALVDLDAADCFADGALLGVEPGVG